MNKYLKMIGFGLLVWLIPFIASFFFFDSATQKLTIDETFFKSIMIVLSSFVGVILLDVATLGVQLHGGNGVTLEYPVSVIYADAPIYSQIEGALNVLDIWCGGAMAGGK